MLDAYFPDQEKDREIEELHESTERELLEMKRLLSLETSSMRRQTRSAEEKSSQMSEQLKTQDNIIRQLR